LQLFGNTLFLPSHIRAYAREFSLTFTEIISHYFSDIILPSQKKNKGIHEGEFMGIPPTGKQITGRAMVFYRTSEGKIAEWYQEADFLNLFMQLSMGLKPNGGKK
jgi:predicted ester cyclase